MIRLGWRTTILSDPWAKLSQPGKNVDSGGVALVQKWALMACVSGAQPEAAYVTCRLCFVGVF